MKRNPLKISAYIICALIIFSITVIHAFKIYTLNQDFLTKYLLSMLFVTLILPLVPYVKIFDIVEIRRDAQLLSKKEIYSSKNRLKG